MFKSSPYIYHLCSGSDRLRYRHFVCSYSLHVGALTQIIGGCGGALFMSWLLAAHSLMTEKISRRGQAVRHTLDIILTSFQQVLKEYSADLYEVILIKDVMKKDTLCFATSTSVKELKVLGHDFITHTHPFRSKCHNLRIPHPNSTSSKCKFQLSHQMASLLVWSPWSLF